MRRIARFLALPAAERAVLLNAFFWLPVTALALRLRLRGLEPGALAVVAPATPTQPGVAPARIAELVAVAARHGVVRGNCLSQSLTLKRLLDRHGVAGTLRVGARRAGAGLEAHAWVEHDGRPLNDGADVAGRYPPFRGRVRGARFMS